MTADNGTFYLDLTSDGRFVLTEGTSELRGTFSIDRATAPPAVGLILTESGAEQPILVLVADRSVLIDLQGREWIKQ
jgi:hypothetical protein